MGFNEDDMTPGEPARQTGSDLAKCEQYKESALDRVAELETQLENERAAHFTCVKMLNEAEAERDMFRTVLQNIATDPTGAGREAAAALGLDGQLRRDGKP